MENIKIDKIIRSKRKTFSIQVAPDGSLILCAPIMTSHETIQKVIEKKRTWILKKQKLVKEKYMQMSPKKFEEGETFFYLGDLYKLYILQNSQVPLEFNNKYFILSGNHSGKAKEIFTDWYKKQAYELFCQRTNGIYSPMLGLKCNGLRITNAKKRWGSCTVSGTLNFNWRLIMAPLNIIDYVVVHELIHIKEKNHSKCYWSKVGKAMPDYKKRRNWLKENGHLLFF